MDHLVATYPNATLLTSGELSVSGVALDLAGRHDEHRMPRILSDAARHAAENRGAARGQASGADDDCGDPVSFRMREDRLRNRSGGVVHHRHGIEPGLQGQPAPVLRGPVRTLARSYVQHDRGRIVEQRPGTTDGLFGAVGAVVAQ